MIRILLVCLGNICRSPTAHGVLQKKVDEAGFSAEVEIDSAGTAAWHIGKSPDSRSVAAATKRGFDLSSLRARQVCDQDFEQFDLILAMDKNNHQELLERCPEPWADKVQMFLPFSQVTLEDEVPDPYYGGSQGFDYVIDLVEQAADNLVGRIESGVL